MYDGGMLAVYCRDASSKESLPGMDAILCRGEGDSGERDASLLGGMVEMDIGVEALLRSNKVSRLSFMSLLFRRFCPASNCEPAKGDEDRGRLVLVSSENASSGPRVKSLNEPIFPSDCVAMLYEFLMRAAAMLPRRLSNCCFQPSPAKRSLLNGLRTILAAIRRRRRRRRHEKPRNARRIQKAMMTRLMISGRRCAESPCDGLECRFLAGTGVLLLVIVLEIVSAPAVEDAGTCVVDDGSVVLRLDFTSFASSLRSKS